MTTVLVHPPDQVHRVIAVELPNAGSAEQLAEELKDLFSAAIIKQEGLLQVAVYGVVGAENRLIVEVLGAVKLWLNRWGAAPVLVQFGDKTSLLEADA